MTSPIKLGGVHHAADEIILVSHVLVQCHGDDAHSRGQRAHAQGIESFGVG